jgi:TonB family protein
MGLALMSLMLANAVPLPSAQPWMSFDDYPTDAIRREQRGVVSFQLKVSAGGRATACEVTESSGSAILDKETCSLAIRRIRFAPSSKGEEAQGLRVYQSAAAWSLPPDGVTISFDRLFEVKKLPQGYVRPVSMRVLFDADGAVTNCSVVADGSGSIAADKFACDWVSKSARIAAPRSASTRPPIALRFWTVAFVAERK